MDSVKGSEIGKNPNMYYVKTICVDCGEVRWSPKMVVNREGFSGRCRKCANKIINNNNSKGWHYVSGGYVEVKLHKDDPYYDMANRRGYVLEHRLVMARKLGRCLRPSEVVHHKNHIRSDNRECNLTLENKSDHDLISLLELQVAQLRSRISELESEKERIKIRL